ncbi:MAG: TolC family protein [Candidatus Omnitrophica bacterium]|nr:TolC family protein [Candidatus Omnitrophota bacterium]
MIIQMRKKGLPILLRIIIPLSFTFYCLPFSFAQQAEILKLDKLIEEALKNNPDLIAAKKRWEASLVRIPQSKSLDNPNLSLSFMKIQKGTLKLDRTMPEDRILSISQMFPLFGKLSLRRKIALVESQMFAAEFKNKELEIIDEVKNAYYELFLNYKEIELKQESLKLLEEIAKIAEAKYIVGEIPQEEVLKINLEIARLSNDITNLKQENKAKQARLNSLLNRQPEDILGTPVLEETLSFDKDIDTLYRLTLENQPELLIFSYAIEKNKYAKSLAKRSFFPDLMTEIGLRGFTSVGIGPWDLMLAFTVPFWFWTKQRYEIKEAIFNLEEAEAAYKAMKNKILLEVKDLATKIEVAKNKIKLYKENLIPILEASIESSLAGFRSGKGDFMMLLDTERMLIETKMSYYQVLVEYNMNLADLERTVGIQLSEVKK